MSDIDELTRLDDSDDARLARLARKAFGTDDAFMVSLCLRELSKAVPESKLEACLRVLADEPSPDYERGYAKAIADVCAWARRMDEDATDTEDVHVMKLVRDVESGAAKGASDE